MILFVVLLSSYFSKIDAKARNFDFRLQKNFELYFPISLLLSRYSTIEKYAVRINKYEEGTWIIFNFI